MTEPVTALSVQTIEALHEQPFVLMHTIDAESGSPASSMISWKVRDAMVNGVCLSNTPEYEKTDDKRAADKMFAAIKKA
ncbi:MAG: hypothetical protein ACQEXQ_00885 [Bacillota bacterium]